MLKYYAGVFKQAGMANRVVSDTLTATDYIVGANDLATMQIHLQAATDGKSIQKLVIVVMYPSKK